MSLRHFALAATAALAACTSPSQDAGPTEPEGRPAANVVAPRVSITVTQLAIPSTGCTSMRVTDINDGGQIVGWCVGPNGLTRGLRWASATASPVFLPAGGVGQQQIPEGINTAGDVAGSANTPSTTPVQGFRLPVGAQNVAFLPMLTGGTASNAMDINASGTVVGMSFRTTEPGFSAPSYHPIRWSATNQILDPVNCSISPCGVGERGRAEAVNAAGTMAGWFSRPPTRPRAFRVVNGVMQFLPNLAGTVESRGTGINDSGDIVGSAIVDSAGSLRTVPTIWRGSTVTEIPPNNFQIRGWAVDIGNDSLVVGADQVNSPFAYRGDVGRWPMPVPSGFAGASPTAINNRGQAVGNVINLTATPPLQPVMWKIKVNW